MSDPECVYRYCACEPSVPHDCDVDCAAVCGSSSSDDASGSTPTNPGDAPIVKAAVGAVVVATFAAMFVLAPAHTLSIIVDTGNGADASRNWDEHQSALASLREEGARLGRLDDDLIAAVRAVDPRPLAHISDRYVPVATATAVDRWAPHGYCGELVQENADFLAAADREATEQGWNTVLDATQATSAMRTGAARLAGPAALADERVALLARYDATMEYKPWIEAMLACAAEPGVAGLDCLNELIAADLPAAAKQLVDRVVGDGHADAIERVRKAGGFYRDYVGRIDDQIEKQTTTAAKCGGRP